MTRITDLAAALDVLGDAPHLADGARRIAAGEALPDDWRAAVALEAALDGLGLAGDLLAAVGRYKAARRDEDAEVAAAIEVVR